MHVAYVCNDLGVPVAGTKGASIHLRAVAQALAVRGHTVTILAANPGEESVPGFRPEVVPVGYDRNLKALKRRMAAHDPCGTTHREVHALLLGTVTSRALRALHRRIPVDAIYERHSLWSWAALAFAREEGLRHVLEVNAPLVEEQRAYRSLSLTGVAEACEGQQISGTDAVLVPSAALARHARGLGAKRSAIHVLPNAVDPELFGHRSSLGRSESPRCDDRFVVVFVGSLKPWHGIDLLLSAFRRLIESVPEAHLLVLGDGPMKAEVEKAARELGPERVTAPGSVPHGEVPAWLARCDVGVAPYPDLEDFYFSPMKVVEYQAAGLAVVASDLGHLRHQIEHRRDGVLVTAGDVHRLARALEELAGDRELVERLGANARERVLEECTWEKVAVRVEELLRSPLPSPVASAAGGERRR